MSLGYDARNIAVSKNVLSVKASAACLVQELIILQMCLKPLVEETPQVTQLYVTRYCVNDQSVPCAQLDLRLCCTPFLQQMKEVFRLSHSIQVDADRVAVHYCTSL